MSALVRAEGISKRYGEFTALEPVDIELHKGRFNLVYGKSGSGKSTLLSMIAGLEKPTEGTITYHFEKSRRLPRHLAMGAAVVGLVTATSKDKLYGDYVGIIPQRPTLTPGQNVLNNITRAHHLAGRKLDRAWLGTLTDELGVRDLLNRFPHELSGGQQQRVAIARAMAHQPEVLLADEATASLDVDTARHTHEMLRYYVDEKDAAVMLVSHNPEAAQYADVVLHLQDGHAIKGAI